MKCFNHRELDAIAVCKHCSRGICPQCVAEVGVSMACKGRCEAEVATLNDLVQRGKSAYAKASESYVKTAIFTGLFGSAFVVFGLQPDNRASAICLTMGVLLLVSSGLYLHSAKRYRSRD